MRRSPGHVGGPVGTAQALRRYLQPSTFTDGPWQWGVVEAVHGGFSSTLYAAASAGAMTLELNGAPSVNDLLLVGTLASSDDVVRVTAVSGSGAPYTATLATGLPSSQSSGAAVKAAKTVDLYLDGTQTLSDLAYLTPGVRWAAGYAAGAGPAAGDVVLVARGIGLSGSDRLVVDRLAV